MRVARSSCESYPANKRVQPTSGVAYRMEYRGQRVPLKRQNVRNTVSLDLPRLTPTQERV